MEALFGQLNKGEAITGGLRKVDKSEMTHKNPALRATAPATNAVASAKPAPPKPSSKPGSVKAKKQAKTALEGNKWCVEFHEGERGIVIDDTSLGQTMNVFGCKDTVIQVKGKINAIQMVSCSKTSIVLDTLVSSLEMTSSSSFTVQVLGVVPTILIDSCDSGQIYLSEACKSVELVTAKSSAINVSVPKPGAEEGEYTEIALPEQLRHQLDDTGKNIKTEVVAHSG
jgi:adenylyl cyclase-associated protein